MVGKNQTGGEKPVLLIGSPMCQTLCGAIMTMMRNAHRVSEAKYKNFVEQCGRDLEKKKEMCQVLGMQENCCCMRWSRGLSGGK